MPDPLTDPLAHELAKLAPAPSAVTPASVLFAAGVQSAERKARRWRTATMGMVTLFVGSWVGMALRPDAGGRDLAGSAFSRGYQPSPPPDAPAAPAPPQNPATPLPNAGNALARDNERKSKHEEPDANRPPSIFVFESIDDETLEMRAKGMRLRSDILTGGLGMIPDRPKAERPLLPYGSYELNPAVLGGFYSPKKTD